MALTSLKDQRGMVLITVYIAFVMISSLSLVAFSKAFWEMRHMEREIARIKSFAAAEAGIQRALAQIGSNGYTGFINTNPINIPSFQDVLGRIVGNVSVTIVNPNQADWATVVSTATVYGNTPVDAAGCVNGNNANNFFDVCDTRRLEGRVFLDSNLSKYLVYANTANFSSGLNAQYGVADYSGTPSNPRGVSSNPDDRASMYYTGNWNADSGVKVFGDVNAQGSINGDNSSTVNGDVYTGAFTTNPNGTVKNSGVIGGVVVGDEFADDIDRNGNGTVDAADYPDYHSLNSQGGGDSHQTETLASIDNTFYKNNNNVSTFGGSTAKDRYLKMTSISDSNGNPATRVTDYTTSAYSKVQGTYDLPANAIVYVNGNAYVKQADIGGRVSVISSKNIYFDGNVTYSAGQQLADETHSAAFMAQQKIFMTAKDLSISGILYAQNLQNDSVAFDASSGGSGSLNLYGNRIINGGTNLGNYYSTRVYGYDKTLKYFRPPGLPVIPSLKTVREV